jgi:hypothetical protein
VLDRPTKKTTESDIRFERAAILFNIASVKSQIACAADRSQPDGLDVACQEFEARGRSIGATGGIT